MSSFCPSGHVAIKQGWCGGSGRPYASEVKKRMRTLGWPIVRDHLAMINQSHRTWCVQHTANMIYSLSCYTLSTVDRNSPVVPIRFSMTDRSTGGMKCPRTGWTRKRKAETQCVGSLMTLLKIVVLELYCFFKIIFLSYLFQQSYISSNICLAQSKMVDILFTCSTFFKALTNVPWLGPLNNL